MKMYINFDYSVKKQKSINRIFENFGRLDSQLWMAFTNCEWHSQNCEWHPQNYFFFFVIEKSLWSPKIFFFSSGDSYQIRAERIFDPSFWHSQITFFFFVIEKSVWSPKTIFFLIRSFLPDPRGAHFCPAYFQIWRK